MKETRVIGVLVFFGLLALAILIEQAVKAPGQPTGSRDRTRRTDGVFESATKKIDSGRPETLTEAERQRIHDLTFGWCSECNTARRLCKHGK